MPAGSGGGVPGPGGLAVGASGGLTPPGGPEHSAPRSSYVPQPPNTGSQTSQPAQQTQYSGKCMLSGPKETKLNKLAYTVN